MPKYQGIFKPKNISKYKGNSLNIVYRSGWELSCMIWCDTHPDVVEWSSEEVVIPYKCVTDNKMHRYFVDLKIKFKNGSTYLVEIKPRDQLLPPKRGKKREKTFLYEVQQYGKNVSKWKQAKIYADSRGYIFQIWTEDILSKLGVKILDTYN
jgi:hypothetical protein